MSLQRRAPAVPGGGGAPTSAQQANRKRLEELLKLPDNAVCADCPERGPRWASATLGTFICIKCSGIHRNLGVHISFVRSVNLDEWKQEHVEQMERWGNARARAYFEAEVPPGYARPSDWSNVHHMTRWIKDKYEYKRFIPRDGALPPEKQRTAAASPFPSTNNEPSSSSSSTRERKPRDRPAGGATQPTAQSSSKPVMAAAPAKPKVVDLLDFSEPDPPAPTAPQQQPPQQAAAVAAVGVGDFDAFGPSASSSVPAPQQPQQPAAPQQPPQAQLTSAGKPKLTPDQLISMFMQQQPSSSAPPAPTPTATPWGAPPPRFQQPQQPQQPQQQQAAFGFPPSFQQQQGMVPQQQMMMGGAGYGGGGFVQQHNNPCAPPQSPYGQQHQQAQGFAGFPPGAMPHQQQQHASSFGPSSSSTFPPHQPSGGNGGFPSPFGHPSNPFG